MSSPMLWGPNNISNNLQNQALMASGALIAWNGPKNLITYGNFQNLLTTGWSLGTIGTLTNGIPTGTPTFGSGASGNLSISIVTSGQLSGVGSLAYVSSAATTQGNMLASQVYNVDPSLYAQVMGWSFSYSVPSGASNGNFSGTSSNSFGVAVWDVTNSAWLGTSANFNLVGTSFPPPATGEVQLASNTAQIRFVIYNVNATSGAITLYLDDFFLGPQYPNAIAPAMSDMTAFTPTGSWTTNTTYTGYYNRVGDEMYLQTRIALSGAPSSGTLYINLPNGLQIDSNKIQLSNSQTIGYGSTFNAGTNVYEVITTTNPSNAGQLYPQVKNTITTQSSITPSVPGTYQSGDYIDFFAQVPIAGWSSNTVQSAASNTRVCGALYTVPTGTITSSFSILKYGTLVSDNFAAYSASTGIYTVPVTGLYNISAAVPIIATFSAGQSASIAIYKNGSLAYRGDQSAGGNNQELFPAVVVNSIPLNAGDQISIYAKCTGSGISIDTGLDNFFSISLQTGPAVVQASESVNMKYYNSSTVLGATTSTVIFTTKDWDTHNSYNNSTGLYTVPISGKYRITSLVSTGGNTASSVPGACYLYARKNQASNTNSNQIAALGLFVYQVASLSIGPVWGGSTDLSCLAGDTIDVACLRDPNVGNISLASDARYTYINIERIGN